MIQCHGLSFSILSHSPCSSIQTMAGKQLKRHIQRHSVSSFSANFSPHLQILHWHDEYIQYYCTVRYFNCFLEQRMSQKHSANIFNGVKIRSSHNDKSTAFQGTRLKCIKMCCSIPKKLESSRTGIWKSYFCFYLVREWRHMSFIAIYNIMNSKYYKQVD